MSNNDDMIFTIKLRFKDTPTKEMVYQDINLELKQNPKLWGAEEVWLDDVEVQKVIYE